MLVLVKAFELLFPAYAGVIPFHGRSRRNAVAFPRIRGGDPYRNAKAAGLDVFSPHTRG